VLSSGEANVNKDMSNYKCYFTNLVHDWRRLWQANRGQVFPFGFVQIGNYCFQKSPELRWHQTADRGFVPNEELPNTFMALALDTPDHEWKIHSKVKEVNKQYAVHTRYAVI